MPVKAGYLAPPGQSPALRNDKSSITGFHDLDCSSTISILTVPSVVIDAVASALAVTGAKTY
jgi:hypothetical protein